MLQAVYIECPENSSGTPDHVPKSTNWKTSRSTDGHLNIAGSHHRDTAAIFQFGSQWHNICSATCGMGE